MQRLRDVQYVGLDHLDVHLDHRDVDVQHVEHDLHCGPQEQEALIS
jgi:hypothetical protein